MDQHQRELRRAAARAFIESLDQLQQTFQPADGQATRSASASGPIAPAAEAAPPALDLMSFEQAAADIEAFFGQADS